MTIKSIVENIEIEKETKKQISSNLIEPTEAMVTEVITRYAQGEDLRTIKINVKKSKTNLTLSYDQIKEIILIWENTKRVKEDDNLVISEDGKTLFSKCSKCGKYPCECKPEEV